MLDRFLYIPGHYDYRRKAFPFFDNEQPVVIEYCSGNGQWIGERARQNPQLIGSLWRKDLKEPARFGSSCIGKGFRISSSFAAEALIFTRFYAPQAAEIYVNFPDPWPKLRHAKNRLVQRRIFQRAAPHVQDQAVPLACTDDPAYAAQMVKNLTNAPMAPPHLMGMNGPLMADPSSTTFGLKRGGRSTI